MVARPGDEYGSYGSVPSVEAQGGGASLQTEHATPESFGGQVGQAVSGLGKEGEQVTNMFGGMIMETAANQSELSYNEAVGALNAKYKQYEGLQAEAMRPQYNAELQQLHQQFRSDLPLMAQKMFDATTMHSLGYQISDYASYAASQVKDANLKSTVALRDSTIAKGGDISTVTDPTRFGELEGTVLHTVNAEADVRDWSAFATGQDANGVLTFGDSPEAQSAKAQYDHLRNDASAKLYLQSAKTIADQQGPGAAASWLQLHWSRMPDAAKVETNQYLAPKLKNETIDGNINSMMGQLTAGFNQQKLSNVPSSPTSGKTDVIGVIRQNEGYTGKIGKDSNGYDVFNGINSKYFPEEFAQAKHILQTEGKEKADAFTDAFYQKDIIDKYNIGALPADTQAIVADGIVNHGGGKFGQSLIAAARNGSSPQELIDMRRAEYQRLATEDPKQYGTSLKGWNARLDTLQKGIAAASPFVSQPNKADYLRNNQQQAIDNAREAYLKKYPDDYWGAQLQENRARSEIDKQIRLEDGKLLADKNAIINAIGGAMTGGKPPLSEQDLKNIPGIAPVYERVMQQQGAFFTSIPKLIKQAQTAHGYGGGALDVANAIANRQITSDFQLQEHLANGDITYEGYKQGINLLKDSSAAKAQVSAFNVIHSQISEQSKTINDPKGEALWSDAMPLLTRQLEQNRQNKIPDSRSYDPNDKDYIGNAVKSLIRSPVERMMDKRRQSIDEANAMTQSQAKQVSELLDKLDSGKLTGDAAREAISEAYRNKTMSRQDALDMLTRYKLIRASAPAANNETAQVQVPRPE